MQTLKLQAHVNTDGSVQLQMPEHLAGQDVEIILVYQSVKSPDSSIDTAMPPEPADPLVGLFAGSPDLSEQAESILERDIKQASGLTWKQS